MAGCSCGSEGKNLIYACSGAANTGYLSDSVARKLMQSGVGSMACLAAVGAGLSGFLESAKCGRNIVIDGCPVACGKQIFEKNGLVFDHFVMTDFGVQKGKTVITNEVVERVAAELAEKI